MRSERAERGKLTSIVAAAKHKYQVDAEISIFTMRTRAKRYKVDPAVRQGTPSPMLSVGPFIVDLCAQLADLRVPINVTTGLQLENSLIAGTSFESEVKHESSCIVCNLDRIQMMMMAVNSSVGDTGKDS